MIIEGAQGPRRFAQERTRAEIDRLAGVRAPAASGHPHIIVPEMIDVSGKSFRVMEGEVTVGLFRQFVDTGYEITGHDADALRMRLGWAPGTYLDYLNLTDDRKLAVWLSEQTGRKFRVPTIDELSAAFSPFRNHLLGSNWELTETTNGAGEVASSRGGSANIIEHFYFPPEYRLFERSVRLVEDKQ